MSSGRHSPAGSWRTITASRARPNPTSGRERLDLHESDVKHARRERMQIEPGDRFEAHDLTAGDISAVVAMIGA